MRKKRDHIGSSYIQGTPVFGTGIKDNNEVVTHL